MIAICPRRYSRPDHRVEPAFACARFSAYAGMLLLAWAESAAAEQGLLRLSAGRIETATLSIEGVNGAITWEGRSATLTANARRMGAPAAEGLQGIRAGCLQMAWDGARLECRDGTISYADPRIGRGRGSFDFNLAPGALHLGVRNVTIAAGQAEAALRGDSSGVQIRAQARGLDLRRLERAYTGLTGRPLPYSQLSGRIDVGLETRGADAGTLELAFTDLNFAGTSSGEGLAGEISADFGHGADRTDFKLAMRLRAGLAYIEPGFELHGMRPGFTFEAPPTPLEIEVKGVWRPSSRRLKLQSKLKHEGVADLEFKTVATLTDQVQLERATLDLEDAALGPFYGQYLQPVLLGTQYADLEIVGRASGRVRVESGRLQRIALRLHDVHAYDGRGRFNLAGLDGALIVTDTDNPQFSALNWQELGIYRLRLGAGALMFESSGGRIDAVGAGAIPFLGGALQLEELGVAYTGKVPRPTLTLSGALESVSLVELTQTLGWPAMQGELAGRLSKLRYRHGRVRLDGDLTMEVFDGRVVMRNLRMHELFERVPRAYADIDFENLDLAGLTQTFAFGRIDGRLSGRLHKFELAAWHPVYFEAEFATPVGDESRHRISRRAVDNLTQLAAGTAGASSGPMSSGLLRLFQSYAYDRLGVRCRLYNGACELGGVVDTPDGFYILTRGGVLPPWIDIKARGRWMPWSMLIGGLKAIREREAVIEFGARARDVQ